MILQVGGTFSRWGEKQKKMDFPATFDFRSLVKMFSKFSSSHFATTRRTTVLNDASQAAPP